MCVMCHGMGTDLEKNLDYRQVTGVGFCQAHVSNSGVLVQPPFWKGGADGRTHENERG